MICIYRTPRTVSVLACLLLACLGAFAEVAEVLAKAVSPNGKTGACGPYYIWYQTTPDVYPPLMDFIDLCGITFDSRDINQDFDFVYFADTAAVQRAALDQNQDGISDLFFVKKDQRLIEWKPEGGCVRINLNECQGGKGFNPRCGYAMISIQPKPNFRDGSANIHISVNAKCPPGGYDCSRAYSLVHRYADCVPAALPDFIVQKTVNPQSAETYREETLQYKVTIRNTGTSNENHVELTDAMSAGTNGGALTLVNFSIDCPQVESFEDPFPPGCNVISVKENEFKVGFSNIPPNKSVTVTYGMLTHKGEIDESEFSYFTNTATLSTGGSSRVTVGVLGMKKPEDKDDDGVGEGSGRPERPISSSQ